MNDRARDAPHAGTTPPNTGTGDQPGTDPYLFDPAPFTDDSKRRTRRRPADLDDAVPAVGEWWDIATKRGPERRVHRVAVDLTYGATRTRCGVVGRKLERLDDGALAHLCQTCNRPDETRTR